MDMVVQQRIHARLAEMEARENVRIFYACESGSRAWGFPSADSDYDVRFLYLHPADWYLSIDWRRDVIECPVDAGLDINGWDLRKALQLLRKSNPPLLEWLGSPIVYLEKYGITAKMRAMASAYCSPTVCAYHYLHMARRNYREYLKGPDLCVKKYFYVLRPLLSINWLERGLGVAPTDFNILLDKLVTEPELRKAIDDLITTKRAGAELDRGPRIEPISRFIESELARLENYEARHKTQSPPPTAELDELLRLSLSEAWNR
jgi:predicted nucleotidyltransferase